MLSVWFASVITAANASGINDGAGALVLATEDAVKKYGYTPLARVVAWSRTGCDPTIMGIGPVDACNTALAVRTDESYSGTSSSS